MFTEVVANLTHQVRETPERVGLRLSCLQVHYYSWVSGQLTKELLLWLLLLHPSFTGLLPRTTGVSRCQKGKTSLDSNEARDDGVWGWQWHQLDHMQTVCTSLQTDNNTNTSSVNFYRPDALPDVQPTVSKYWKQMTVTRITIITVITQKPVYGAAGLQQPCLTFFYNSAASERILNIGQRLAKIQEEVQRHLFEPQGQTVHSRAKL